MDFEIYSSLNNYSLHSLLTSPESDCINQKKSERLATKDIEWAEIHTITTAGYIHNPSKLGFDGYDSLSGIGCEVKSSSKVINKDLISKFSDGLISKRNEFIENPIDGRGIFSLFTHDSYHRHIESQVLMLVSAYINGVLMFIIEFPFEHETFKNHIKRMLDKSLPNGDEPGRSKTISFAYTKYQDCDSTRLVYLTKKANHKVLKGACTKNFYAYLNSLQKTEFSNSLHPDTNIFKT